MEWAGGGRIVLVSSTAGLSASPTAALSYSVTKAAIATLPRLLALELALSKVLINSVAPGMIATPGTRANSEEEAFDRMTAMQAIKRRVEPEHVADLVAFLASDDAAMITGQTIVCDGGSFLH